MGARLCASSNRWVGRLCGRQVAISSTKDGELITLSIPDHREVAKGTLRSLIRTAGLTVEEFVAAK